MAAPDLTKRTTVFVAKIGTDDAGYNVVGAPQPRLSIAQALADLASGYDAATPTAPKTISLEPGTYTTPAFALPPNVFIQADPDDQSGSDGEVIINLTGNITLAAAWTANAAAIGGFRGVTIRPTVAEMIDLTMPVPVAGNPARRIFLYDVRTSVPSLSWEATSTADALAVRNLVQDGTSTDLVEFSAGTQVIETAKSAAPMLFNDTATMAAVIQCYALFMSAAPANTTPGVSFVSSTGGVTARMGACDNRALTLNRGGAGALTVYADAVSIPLVANLTFLGTATQANLIRTTDSGGITPGGGGGVGTLAFTNAAGNTTITPAGDSVWTTQATFTGAAGTRILIMDVAAPGLTAGQTCSIFTSRTDGAGIVIEIRNATAGGTLLATIPDGTGGTTAKIDLVYGTIATGYAANAWAAQSFQIPATV